MGNNFFDKDSKGSGHGDVHNTLFGSGNRRRARRGQEYDRERAAITDDEGNYEFDEQGYTPTMPGRRVARDAQYQSERFISQRNAQIRRDALGALQGGLGNLQSYRPGGSAAMASPFYSQQAEVLMNSQLEVPDLLAEVRRAQQGKANKAARTAQYVQIAAAVVGAAATIATGGAAAPLVGAAMSGLSAYQQGKQQQQVDAETADVPDVAEAPVSLSGSAQAGGEASGGAMATPGAGQPTAGPQGTAMGGPGTKTGKRPVMGATGAGQPMGQGTGAGTAGGQQPQQGAQAGAGGPAAAGQPNAALGAFDSSASPGAAMLAQTMPPEAASAAAIGGYLAFLEDSESEAWVEGRIRHTRQLEEMVSRPW